MFIGFYNKSIILTFIGLFFTVLGIRLAVVGEYNIALICLLIAGICDTFDGTIARRVKRNDKEKLYGVELDSLVDVICFGIYPIIISMSLNYISFFNIIIYFIFIFCGVTRLAYFNIDLEKSKHFKGLPITMSSFILPIVLLFTTNEIIVMFTFLILSFLFVFNFKIPKSDIKLKFLYLLIGILIITLVLLKVIGIIL